MRGSSPPARTAGKAHILVVDDDRRLRGMLGRYLGEARFRVTAVGDAEAARAVMAGIRFDLIVLDVMLPGESGMEFSAALGAGPDRPPVLLLTAMGEVRDRVRGLETGADDYLVKPFEPRELVLRIDAILRRRRLGVAPPEPLRLGALVYDPARGALTREDGEEVRLTTAEAALLAALADRAGEPVSREELAAKSGTLDRTVDAQVARLRRKIEPVPSRPRFLATVWGRGYVLRPG